MSNETTEAPKKKKSDLLPRLITAIVAIPILLALIFPAPPWAFFALAALAGAISAWEYTAICVGKEPYGARILAAILAAGVHAVLYFAVEYLPHTLIASAWVVMLYFLFAYKDQKKVTAQIGSCITAVIYAGLMFSCIALLHRDAQAAGPYWVVMVLVVIWFSDTGAYFAGRALGKTKLYEAVSPNKTVEGAVGGLVTSVAGAIGCNYLFVSLSGGDWQAMELWQVFAIAVPANLLGQTGDLVESLVKRAHGVKDSGTIIYGHGGMLDRIDALIFAAPWFFFGYHHLLT